MSQKSAVAPFFAFLLLFVFSETVLSQITVYSGRNRALVEPLVRQFEAETGYTVRIRYGGTTQLAVAILEEGRRSPADVFWSQDAGALGALHTDGRLATLPDSLTEKLPSQFRSSANTWVATSGRARVFAYDVNAISKDQLPGSVFNLTSAEWRGRIGWAPANASFQSFVTSMIAAEGEDTTRRWLEDMKANGTVAYNNNNSILQAIEAGEISAGITNHYYIDRAAAEKSEYPVAYHFFDAGDIGNLVNVAGMGIIGSSRNQDAALQFIDFMLRDHAQLFFMNEVFEYPVITGLEGSARNLDDILNRTPDLDLDALRDLDRTLRLLRQTGLL